MKEQILVEELHEKNFKDNIVEEDNKEAIVTHYLHNYNNEVKDHFEDEALAYLNQIVKYKNVEENLNFVSDSAIQQLLYEVENVPFTTPKNPTFKFIDLFAGIGGFRIALQNIGGECVYTSEWNVDSKKTYKANFGQVPFGDITLKSTKNYIPNDFQILCAGFPCQAFSIAGNRKDFKIQEGLCFLIWKKLLKLKDPKLFFLKM